jgi:thiol-disulfide isomerase/thioredoxin
MKRRTLILGATGLGAMGLAGWLAWQSSSRRAPAANRAVMQGPEAARPKDPDPQAFFSSTLPDLQGQPFAMSALKGRPIVVNFWATWCPPCVEEMPLLDRLSKDIPQVKFVGIGIDTAKNIVEFAAKIPVGFPLYVAGHGGIAMVRDLGNAAGGLPFTVLIDTKGQIFKLILGQVEANSLRNNITELLAQSA